MNKKVPILYKIGKIVISPIFKLYYSPKSIGHDIIPKEGPILIVGNHKHLFDQFLTITKTKRGIHYMAKKEYFDNKKVAWFFKSAGCIPVDRTKKDEKATTSAIKVLEEDEVLGIFPEGTRNGLKEERIKELYENYFKKEIEYNEFFKKVKMNKTSQVNCLETIMNDKKITIEEFKKNIYQTDKYLKKLIKDKIITKKYYYDNILLPLKYGTVSLAKKTKSKIVPFVIIGDYKFRGNNLKVIIGKPIDVEDDLEKANINLDKTMKKMIEENSNY